MAGPAPELGSALVSTREEFKLPELPYAYDALESVIDKETMTIHHTKHHQAYINNANNALKDHPELAALEAEVLIQDLSKVPEAIRTVDKAVTKGVMHRNTAARRKSALAHSLAASS